MRTRNVKGGIAFNNYEYNHNLPVFRIFSFLHQSYKFSMNQEHEKLSLPCHTA